MVLRVIKNIIFAVWDFVIKYWHITLPAIGVLIIVFFFYRSCHKPPKLLDEKAIQTAQKAIAENDRKTMVDILVQSDVAEKQIDATVANSKADTINSINEAKKNAEAMTNDELAAELNRRAQQ